MTPPESPAASSDSKSASAPQVRAAASPGSALLHAQESDRVPDTPRADPSRNPALGTLPLHLNVSVPVPNFRVRQLLALDKGAVFETNWPHGEDVPVWCGGAQLVWTEFEVVENVLAVRVTRVL